MAYRALLLDSLRAAIGTVWPEVVENGIVRTSQSARSSVDQRVREDTFPFAAIEVLLTSTDDWGGDNLTEAGDLLVYYVAADSTDEETIETKCEELRDYLWTTDALSHAQVIAEPILPDPKNVSLMEYFLATQRPLTAGALSIQVVAGEMP